jgi:hypothetical protein
MTDTETTWSNATDQSPSFPSTVRIAATPSTAGRQRKLFDAFRAFDTDEGASVAVFTGVGGAFCAAADLKAVAVGDPISGASPAATTASRRWGRAGCG